MSNYMTLSPGAAAPTLAHEERPHVCGKCRNPWTNGNPNCANAHKETGL